MILFVNSFQRSSPARSRRTFATSRRSDGHEWTDMRDKTSGKKRNYHRKLSTRLSAVKGCLITGIISPQRLGFSSSSARLENDYRRLSRPLKAISLKTARASSFPVWDANLSRYRSCDRDDSLPTKICRRVS